MIMAYLIYFKLIDESGKTKDQTTPMKIYFQSLKCSHQFSVVDKCAQCDMNADCIYGRCRCRKGYIGTGYVCEESK